MPLQTAYTMTKHAVQNFTECLALEADLTGKPIHVSAVIPGMVKTRIFEPTAPTEGENPAAAHHRKVMREMMAAYGMDLEVACRSCRLFYNAGERTLSSRCPIFSAMHTPHTRRPARLCIACVVGADDDVLASNYFVCGRRRATRFAIAA
jgi:hypothetical protein